MTDYISREAAQKVLCDACGNAACPKGLIPRCSFYEKMQSIPAADVRPVVHGKLIHETIDTHSSTTGKFYSPTAICSICGSRIISNVNFCPFCGVDVREEEE